MAAVAAAYNSHEDYDMLLKVVLIGDAGVGKTSILHTHRTRQFDKLTKATIQLDFIILDRELNGKKIRLQIWDTAGQERYRSICSLYYKKADAVLVVYDVTARESFESVPHWLHEVEKNLTYEVPILIVANKTDLEERMVKNTDGILLACRHNVPHLQCSATDLVQCDELLDIVSTLAMQHHGRLARKNESSQGARDSGLKQLHFSPGAPPRESGFMSEMKKCSC